MAGTRKDQTEPGKYDKCAVCGCVPDSLVHTARPGDRLTHDFKPTPTVLSKNVTEECPFCYRQIPADSDCPYCPARLSAGSAGRGEAHTRTEG